MYVVDASVWVARFSPTDAFHADSREWIAGTIPGRAPLVEPTIVLAEVAGALSRSAGDSNLGHQALAYLTSLPGLTFVTVDLNLAKRAGEIAAALNLRGYDATYVALAEAEGLELVSWDSDHLSRAVSRVPVRRPSDIIASWRSQP